MAEFKAITTQEEFDAAIKDRIARNTKTVTDEVTKKYEGWISPDDFSAKTKELNDKFDSLTKQAAEKDKSIADLTAENKSAKLTALKTKIAHEKGIPYELAARLNGETEEDLIKDAETLAGFVQNHPTAPLKNTDGGAELSGVEKRFYEKNPGLRNS
jgi:hypothetical protein